MDRLSDEGYSDDEDTSWKIRRAATKLLSAIITAYPNLLQDIYPSACQALTARFREREETVKVDTFNALVDLVRQVCFSYRLTSFSLSCRAWHTSLLRWNTHGKSRA